MHGMTALTRRPEEGMSARGRSGGEAIRSIHARTANTPEIWFAAGVRTPFAKVDGPLGTFDAIGLSVPVVRHMIEELHGDTPDFAVWGTVVPNLTWSNIAREVLMDAGVAPTIPAFSTVMACSTSMIGAIEAAGMIDGLQPQPRTGRRCREHESDPARPGPIALRLDTQIPAGTIVGTEGLACHRPEARRREALYPCRE